jgi:hypothetical protein
MRINKKMNNDYMTLKDFIGGIIIVTLVIVTTYLILLIGG